MKRIIFFIFIIGHSYAVTQYDLNIFEKNRLNNKERKIKYHILQGEPLKAKAIFNANNTLFQKAGISQYYETIFYFLEKNYQKVLELTASTDQLQFAQKRQVCQLQSVAQLFSKDFEHLYARWRRCFALNEFSSHMNQFWFKLLIEHFEFKNDIFHQTRFDLYRNDINELKTWLKLALFLGKQDEVLDYLLNLPVDYYKDVELKEIISHLFYADKKVQLAHQMINGADTSRKNLIDANLFIAADKYEEAKEHFQQGLKNDPSSQFTLNRLIQIAFLENNYDETLKWLNYYQKLKSDLPLDYLWKKSLIHIIKGENDLAADTLAEYRAKAKTLGNASVYHLLKFLSFQDENQKETLYYSLRSCERGDDSGCWLTLIMKKDFEELKNIKADYKDQEDFIEKVKNNETLQVKQQTELGDKPLYSQSDLNHLDLLEKTMDHFYLPASTP